MEFYSDFHNFQLDQIKNTKVLEDELFGLEKTYGAENELCQMLERELNSIERDFCYEKVRSLKASSCKYETIEKISQIEDSIRDEKSRLAKIQDAASGKKYRVQKECQNVEERAVAMMSFFEKKESSRKIFELEDILAEEESYLTNLAANSQSAIKEIGNLNIKDSDISAQNNATIVGVASTVLKLKRMKSQTKSSVKAPINNQPNQLRNFSTSSTWSRNNESRTESFLEHLKTKYQANQLQTKDSRFFQESLGRKPLLSTTQLPLRSPLLLKGQKSIFQRKEFQTPENLTQVQEPMLVPPKRPIKPTQQSVLPPQQVQPPMNKMPLLPPVQLQKPVNKLHKELTMPPPKQLLTPLQKMQNTAHPPQSLLQTPQQQVQQTVIPPKPIPKPSSIMQNRKSEQVNIMENPKDAMSAVTMTKPFEFPVSSKQQSSIDNDTINDIFSSKPGENSGGFGGGFSFLTGGLSGSDDLDSLFGGSSTGFLF